MKAALAPPSAMPGLILASSSRYRAGLLARFGLSFGQISPDLDESALPGETPAGLARRLGREKALAVARQYPHNWVIGSDQVASFDDLAPIGKPETVERALAQLRQASGRTMKVYTSVSLQCLDQHFDQTLLDVVTVSFRHLSEAQIRHYVTTEMPLDCAGSVKSEGLGGALLASVDNSDPSALIGLPLIKVIDLFLNAGIDILSPKHPFAAPSELAGCTPGGRA